MEDSSPNRINLAQPRRGQRYVELGAHRAAADAGRFARGLLVGSMLVVGASLIASLGSVSDRHDPAGPWPRVVEQELRLATAAGWHQVTPLAALTIEVLSLDAALREPAPENPWRSLIAPRPRLRPEEERDLVHAANQARGRLQEELDRWEARLLDLAPDEAPVRLLGLARWTLRGGDLAKAQLHYERAAGLRRLGSAANDVTTPPAAR